jgi:hypothetical protein
MDKISILFFGMHENGSYDFIINEILPQNKEKNVEFISYEESLVSEKTYDVFVYRARYQLNYPWGFIPTFEQVLEAVQKFKPKIIIQTDDEFWYEDYLQQHNSLGNHCELFLRQHHHWNYEYTDNTVHIPLGYCNDFDLSQKVILPIKDRILNWSFIGCEKTDRRECIEKFLTIEKCVIGLQPVGITQLKQIISRKFLVETYLNTIFAPATRGWTTLDVMRLYESTMCGCIPVVAAPQDHCDIYFKYEENPPWIFSETWEQAAQICKDLLNDKDRLQEMQEQNLNWWNTRMGRVKSKVQQVFP